MKFNRHCQFYNGPDSQEQSEDLGFEGLKRAAIHGVHHLLGIENDLMSLIKELWTNRCPYSVPPGTQFGSTLKHVQTRSHRLQR